MKRRRSPAHARVERMYLADLLRRTKRAACIACGAKPGKPCIFLNGPRKGREMAGRHWDRANEARRLGYVDGRWFLPVER